MAPMLNDDAMENAVRHPIVARFASNLEHFHAEKRLHERKAPFAFVLAAAELLHRLVRARALHRRVPLELTHAGERRDEVELLLQKERHVHGEKLLCSVVHEGTRVDEHLPGGVEKGKKNGCRLSNLASADGLA